MDHLNESTYTRILSAWERRNPTRAKDEPPTLRHIPVIRGIPAGSRPPGRSRAASTCPHGVGWSTCRPCRRAYKNQQYYDEVHHIQRKPGERVDLVLAEMRETL